MKKEKIAVVVVTYNRKNMLRECLNSLLKQTHKLDSIIIMNNASTDGTEEMLKKEYLHNKIFDYVNLGKNLGGAGGFHYGIKRAYEKGFDWIWVMDDDVEPKKNCLRNLMEYKNLENLGILCPLRLWKEDLNPVLFEPKKLNLENPFKKIHLDIINLRDIKKKFLKIEGFSFEGPLINAKVVKKVGFPDKTKFILYDDTDYAIRIKRSYNIYMITDANLLKKVRNTNELYSWKEYYEFRNKLIIYRDYSPIYVKMLRLIPMAIFKIGKNVHSFKKFRIFFMAAFNAYFNRNKNYLPEELG